MEFSEKRVYIGFDAPRLPTRFERKAARTDAAEAATTYPTTLDIQRYLLSHSPWLDPATTVDTVKSGDPTKPVRKAGVCWMPSIWDLKAAHEAGCDLMIVHEPTFWDHSQLEIPWRAKAPGIAKQKFLNESGLVILRAHDSWDNWPEAGIRDSWAAALGLGKRIKDGEVLRYTALYEIPNQTLSQLARRVANRIQRYGEDSVQVIGDPEMRVRTVAIGTGMAVPDQDLADAGADAMIMTFDGAWYWYLRERMAERGIGILTVEHGTSEMPGMENLAKHLREVFPNVEFVYFAEHPRTWTARPNLLRRGVKRLVKWTAEEW